MKTALATSLALLALTESYPVYQVSYWSANNPTCSGTTRMSFTWDVGTDSCKSFVPVNTDVADSVSNPIYTDTSLIYTYHPRTSTCQSGRTGQKYAYTDSCTYQTEGNNYYLKITCVQKTANDPPCPPSSTDGTSSTTSPFTSPTIPSPPSASRCSAPLLTSFSGPDPTCSGATSGSNAHHWPLPSDPSYCHGWEATDPTGKVHENSANDIKCLANGRGFSYMQYPASLTCQGTGNYKEFIMNECHQGNPPVLYDQAVNVNCCVDPNGPGCSVGVPSVSNMATTGNKIYMNGELCEEPSTEPFTGTSSEFTVSSKFTGAAVTSTKFTGKFGSTTTSATSGSTKFTGPSGITGTGTVSGRGSGRVKFGGRFGRLGR